MSTAWDRDRTAIVTGGASGIGLAIAERLAHEGANVAVLDRDGDAAELAAAKLEAVGVRALGLSADVTDRQQVDAAVMTVEARLGAPTILVNSAGLDGFEPFLRITADRWDRIIAFLVRDEAGYVTGQVVGVNGGRTTA